MAKPTSAEVMDLVTWESFSLVSQIRNPLLQ